MAKTDQNTVHNWKTTRETPTETVDVCADHCEATGRHSKKDGQLTEFDFEGQVPSRERMVQDEP